MNQPLLQLYTELFAGRKDVYARATTVVRGKARYMRVDESLTLEVLNDHLEGKHQLGVYPIVDGKVKWGAIDIDGPKDVDTKEFLPDAWATVWPQAVQQRNALRAAGLHSYIERSRSGNGAHVWVFFDDWVDAGVVRRLLYNLLTVEKKTPEVVYPVQETTSGENLGNLLALPYNKESFDKGFGTFLKADASPVPLFEFINAVRRNSTDILPEVPEASDTATTVARTSSDIYRPDPLLRGALKIISPYGCKFMHHVWENRKTINEPEWHVAIQQTTCFQNGREFAHALSRDYPKYSKRETDQKFDNAVKNPVAGCSYIREKFPNLVCTNCPGKAPYEVATRSIIQLVQSSSDHIEKVGSFKEDLKLIEAYNTGKLKNGIDWGIEGISRSHQLRDSELVIVAGFPSMGKTWFMIGNAVKLALSGVPVFLFSAETARKQLRQRILSVLSTVDLSAMRGERITPVSTDEWSLLNRAAKRLETLPLYTDYTSMSPAQILNQIEDVLLRDKIPLNSPYVIFFDYLQFGFREPGEESDTERIGRLAGEFKFVSKIVNHPSVVFSQLRREKEMTDVEGETINPELNWLANSANVERTADGVFFLVGRRMGGLYAPRQLVKMKDRDGIAPTTTNLLLQQNCGGWRCTDMDERIETLEELHGHR